LRSTDVLRLLKLWGPATTQFSLTTLLSVGNADNFPVAFDPVSTPEPSSQWQKLLDEWGEWPTLLSMTFPHLAEQQDSLFRLNSDGRFRGLSPLFRSDSFVMIDSRDIAPPRNGDIDQEPWNRKIYVLRQQGDILCGYLECNETHIALQPHPLAGVPRLIFRRNGAQILGRVIAVASRL